MQPNEADPWGVMQRMMKGLTVCLAILVIAGACYVGSYVYFRETRAVKIESAMSIMFMFRYANELDERFATGYAPLIWLDRKITGTTVGFVKGGTMIAL